MYQMNLMYLFWRCGGTVKNILGKNVLAVICGCFGRFSRLFLKLWGAVFEFIYVHQVHRVTMRRKNADFLIFDVLDVHGCIYVMYKEIFKNAVNSVLWPISSMYMRSTSMYIEDEKNGG
jgi:hypothetical protein